MIPAMPGLKSDPPTATTTQPLDPLMDESNLEVWVGFDARYRPVLESAARGLGRSLAQTGIGRRRSRSGLKAARRMLRKRGIRLDRVDMAPFRFGMEMAPDLLARTGAGVAREVWPFFRSRSPAIRVHSHPGLGMKKQERKSKKS